MGYRLWGGGRGRHPRTGVDRWPFWSWLSCQAEGRAHAVSFPRVTDEVFNFLLVWYYCTLTIRESILISNGSR